MFVTYGLIIVPTVFFLMNVANLLHPVVVVLGTLSAAATIWWVRLGYNSIPFSLLVSSPTLSFSLLSSFLLPFLVNFKLL